MIYVFAEVSRERLSFETTATDIFGSSPSTEKIILKHFSILCFKESDDEEEGSQPNVGKVKRTKSKVEQVLLLFLFTCSCERSVK